MFNFRGTNVKPHSRSKWDSSNSLVLPPMPTTLVGICRLVQIYYVLTVSLDSEKDSDVVQVSFPITIGTEPFRIPNSNRTPSIKYGTVCFSFFFCVVWDFICCFFGCRECVQSRRRRAVHRAGVPARTGVRRQRAPPQGADRSLQASLRDCG